MEHASLGPPPVPSSQGIATQLLSRFEKACVSTGVGFEEACLAADPHSKASKLKTRFEEAASRVGMTLDELHSHWEECTQGDSGSCTSASAASNTSNCESSKKRRRKRRKSGAHESASDKKQKAVGDQQEDVAKQAGVIDVGGAAEYDAQLETQEYDAAALAAQHKLEIERSGVDGDVSPAASSKSTPRPFMGAMPSAPSALPAPISQLQRLGSAGATAASVADLASAGKANSNNARAEWARFMRRTKKKDFKLGAELETHGSELFNLWLQEGDDMNRVELKMQRLMEKATKGKNIWSTLKKRDLIARYGEAKAANIMQKKLKVWCGVVKALL